MPSVLQLFGLTVMPEFGALVFSVTLLLHYHQNKQIESGRIDWYSFIWLDYK